MRHGGFGLRHVEQRDIATERIEHVSLGVHLTRRDVPKDIALEPPQEQADVRNVVSASRVVDVAHVGQVRGLLERCVVQSDGTSAANVDRERVRGPRVVDVLRRGRALEEFHRLAAPAGDVAGELFEHGGRALPPAVRQRVGDVAPLAEGRLLVGGRGAWQYPDAEQIGDVRHDPLVAGLDEPVVVQPADVVLDQLHFAIDDVQQRA